HVAVVNEVFTPTAAQIDQATRVIAALDAAESSGIGAVVHDGKMIDVAMARTAAALMADAEAIRRTG
ncbi:MAG TPA: CoA ester lyase, partial [Ilumatobacteraceae bacterium]|nr:CoA ester lyase [Ilumatobacteraceae bacterium]